MRGTARDSGCERSRRGQQPEKPSSIFRRFVLLSLVSLSVAGSFFVGRRIYYRLIQPAPLWTIQTSKSERIVASVGLTASLWADETLVHNPTSLSLDERGRVWVSEAINYRDWQNDLRASGKAFLDAGDQIVILEDTDSDGKADTRTVFAQDPDLIAPTGVCVLGNRVFVSCSPSILMFVDDDGDDKADRKETLLTGFGGQDHDHGVHSVTLGPNGRLYFAVGNAGPHVVTDTSAWTLRSGSLYQSAQPADINRTSGIAVPVRLNSGGITSDDGQIYTGGLVLSVQPDGSDLRVHAQNARNSYEVCVDSFGDLWQTDNDDSSGCRMTWLFDGANSGFASKDGSRSWQADQRPGQSIGGAQWHQDDPGVAPAGHIYGTGAPTGLLRYEGILPGHDSPGSILACDAGLGCVFAFEPCVEGAGYGFHAQRVIWSEPLTEESAEPRPDGLARTWFRPTDIAAGPDGSFYVADWYDSYVGAHRTTDEAAAGRIYLIKPTQPTSIQNDDGATLTNASTNMASKLKTAAGTGMRLSDIASHIPSVQWKARQAILKLGSDAVLPLKEWLFSSSGFMKARAIWLLAQIDDDEAGQTIRQLCTDKDPMIRQTAFRALKSNGVSPLELIAHAVRDPSAAVRREAALALRGIPFDIAKPFILELAEQLDVNDRTAVETFGLACETHAEEIYDQLSQAFADRPGNWSTKFATIVWRLHPVAALPELKKRLYARPLTDPERKQTIDTIAFSDSEVALSILSELATKTSMNSDPPIIISPELQTYIQWWIERLGDSPLQNNRSSADHSEDDLSVRFVAAAPDPIDVNLIQRVASLSGDSERGQILFSSSKATCSNCHRVNGHGADMGPELTNVARRLDRQQIVEAILYPSRSIVTGYESWSIVTSRGVTQTGLLLSVGQTIVLKSADGMRHSEQRSQVDELIRQGTSFMPKLPAGILSEQEIADIVSFLSSATTSTNDR